MYSNLGIILTLLGFAFSSPVISHLQDSSCPSDWVHAQTEGCFKFLSSEVNITWLDAQYACEKEGGYLAEPKTAKQMEFLTGIASLEESFFGITSWWIGLEGVWTWQHSREEASQGFWGEGSPSSQSDNKLDCAYVQLKNGQLLWKDDDCRINSVGILSMAPICQREIISPDQKTTTRRPETSVPASTTGWLASTTGWTASTTGWPASTTGWPASTTGRPLTTTTETIKECPDAWSKFERSCFYIVGESMTWLDARKRCHSMGADLASIHSNEQDKFMDRLIGAYKYETYWLGGTDSKSEGNWTWTNGSPWNYEKWSGHELGGVERNCLSKYVSSIPEYNPSYWEDRQCAIGFKFVCEIKVNN